MHRFRVGGESPETEKLMDQIYARSPQGPQPKFPEVTGVCRTCGNALIMRRRYSEVPVVICQAYGQAQSRMPLDIIECTSYSKRNAVTLRDMAEIAVLIDQRKVGGQYL